MGDLYPTPTRRALLARVDAGDVLDDPGATARTWLVDPDPPYDRVKVCARIRELLAAGWVEQAGGCGYRLTDAGRAAMTGEPGPPGGYGPQQLADRLGLHEWQVDRARAAGLIPAPVKDRWSAAVVEDLAQRTDHIRAAAGSIPDLGAVRAAQRLADRFGVPVEPGVLLELDRRGLIPRVGGYKDHPVYCGRALEAFTDRAALDEAAVAGRLLTGDEAAAFLRVRRSDLGHLVRAGLLAPATYVRSGWQRRRERPAVALYRAGDLNDVNALTDIDWAAVRATPAGRRSVLATLNQETTP